MCFPIDHEPTKVPCDVTRKWFVFFQLTGSWCYSVNLPDSLSYESPVGVLKNYVCSVTDYAGALSVRSSLSRKYFASGWSIIGGTTNPQRFTTHFIEISEYVVPSDATKGLARIKRLVRGLGEHWSDDLVKLYPIISAQTVWKRDRKPATRRKTTKCVFTLKWIVWGNGTRLKIDIAWNSTVRQSRDGPIDVSFDFLHTRIYNVHLRQLSHEFCSKKCYLLHDKLNKFESVYLIVALYRIIYATSKMLLILDKRMFLSFAIRLVLKENTVNEGWVQ